MKKSYVFITLIATLSLLCITSCTKENKKTPSQETTHVLRLNTQTDITSLHPHKALDTYSRVFEQALFEGLMRMGENDIPTFGLAQSYEISHDNMRYTFTLRPSMWSNGEKVTAYHFEKAWQWAVTPEAACIRADLFYSIKNAKKIRLGQLPVEQLGAHALNDTTFVVDLEHPAPYFLELITNTFFFPLYEINHKEPTVFNGPYILSAYERGTRLVMKKNPLYWDAQNVVLEGIESSFITDAYTSMMMYEKGEFDWIGAPFVTLPLDSLEHAKKLKGFASYPTTGTYWYCCNKDQPLMNSVKIRRALSIVLNRSEICEKALVGATPAKSILPSTLTFMKESDLYQDNDPQQARALFDEGIQELGLQRPFLPSIEITHGDNAEQKKLAELLQRIWEKTFDVKVTLLGNQWTQFSAKIMSRQFQIAGCRWFSVYNDPTYNLEFFKEATNRYNTAGWENARYKELLELADYTLDPNIRSSYLKEAEFLIMEEMPVIPIFSVGFEYLLSDRVKGVRLSPVGFPDFKKIYIDDQT